MEEANREKAGEARDRKRVSGTLDRINEAWLQGRPGDLAPMLHEGIVMVLPGFSGRAEGRRAVIAGFEDFCRDARVGRFEEKDRQVDVLGNVAVATFRFDMDYELAGRMHHSTGRDVWVFGKDRQSWMAVWRVMLDVTDEPL